MRKPLAHSGAVAGVFLALQEEPMFYVTADIRYLDGTLAGLTIPGGFRTSEPDIAHAVKRQRWLRGVMEAGDFIRAAVTGNRYEIVGGIRAEVIS